MSFDSLLGNDRLKENLARSLGRGAVSHFYLISGPRGSGRHTLARLLAAAILCKGPHRPCMQCGPCRKLLEGNHPDFITVTDPEKKFVPVDTVRKYRDDMFIRPNESDHKIYFFPQELRIEGQNALLKILEEPPAYGVFILLTDNPEKLLPTVRSRCTELKLQPLPEPILRRQLKQDFPNASPEDLDAVLFRSGGLLGQARELLQSGENFPQQTLDFLEAFGARDPLLLTQTLVPMEKWKRDALVEILQSWLELTEGALACRSGLQSPSGHVRNLAARRTPAELYEACGHLRKAMDYAMSNVSPGAVCGWLLWALR